MLNYLEASEWAEAKTRALNILRLKSLESSPALELLPAGMAYRLEAQGINARIQAEARKNRQLRQIRKELRGDAPEATR